MSRSLHTISRLNNGARCISEPRYRLTTVGGARGFRRTPSVTSAAARAARHQYLDDPDVDTDANAGDFVAGSSSAYEARDSDGAGGPIFKKEMRRADPAPLIAHLQQLFPPLEFNPKLAKQMLTHISAREAWEGHNARLAFLGRRAMNMSLQLFLQTIPPFKFTLDTEDVAYRTLFTNLVGEQVGSAWDLSKVMLWTPALPGQQHQLKGKEADRREFLPGRVGLYKVQGVTVEAIMGGIFHQYGGAVAHTAFHTRVLPHLLCPSTPQGLHDGLHDMVLDVLDRMGGPEASLLPTSSSPQAGRGTHKSRNVNAL